MKRELTCITCPRGCRITVTLDDQHQVTEVAGNTCGRGERYAISEVSHPVRMISSTVKILQGTQILLPVATSAAIDKDLIMEVMDVIRKTQVTAPVRAGDVIIENILDSGIDIIASRSVKRI